MEHTMVNSKAALAGILAMLVACVMAVVVASPALAQDGDEGGDGASARAGDASARAGSVQVQIQYCPQIIDQYASAVQNNTGDAVVAAIAQDLDINQNAVNACIQADGDINLGGDGNGTPAEDQYDSSDNNGDDTDTEERTVEQNGETIIMPEGVAGKTLANTGGLSASATLLPAGALLVVSGVMMAAWVGNRRR